MSYNKTVANVFIGCCLSSFIMEVLMAKSPDSANLITFLQFVFITLQGLFTMKSDMVCNIQLEMCLCVLASMACFLFQLSPKIPLKQYFVLVSLFFVTSVANNYVYALHVPSTLHMIIRSASSPASMLVSWYTKAKRPKLNSIIGSILISTGVALAMYGGTKVVDERKGKFIYWCIGVIILLSTLISGAFTGLQQENLYTKYGKYPEEMLFYTHALPLPLFLGISSQLQSTALNLTWDIWSFIVINIIAQFYCAHSVHDLATKEPSVTVTFMLTLRKFVSLLISAIVFSNNLTLLHVVGTLLVVIGTYFYFNFFSLRQQQPVSLKDK